MTPALTRAEKADEILLRGLLTVERVERTNAGRVVSATCRSRTDREKIYRLGFDPRNGEWRCGCPVSGKHFCSHLLALQRVTTHLAVRDH